jgi:hypothetical protein
LNQLHNFLLVSRTNTPLISEKIGDCLLTPARGFFGGKQVIVFHDNSMHISDQHISNLSSNKYAQVALKIAAVALLPISLIGALIKLSCLINKSYRAFCFQKLPPNSTNHPQLLEMYQHVHNTCNFVSGSGFPGDIRPARINLDSLGLYECACSDSGAYNRFTSSRRNKLENAIVQRLVDTKSNKNTPIKLLSMGSGGLMSDFITLEKLVLAGFKDISIDFVDPKEDNEKRIANINEFFNKYPEIAIKMQSYKKIDAIPDAKRNYDAVLAVDFEPLSSALKEEALLSAIDLTKARRSIAEKGFLALGFSNEDSLFGPHMDNVRVLSRHQPVMLRLAANLSEQLPEKKELQIVVPSLDFPFINGFLFAMALAIEKASKNYDKVSVSYLREQDRIQIETQKFQELLQGFFPSAQVECKQHQLHEKCDFLYTGSLEEEVETKQHLDLLSERATAYILYPQGNIYAQKADPKERPLRII